MGEPLLFKALGALLGYPTEELVSALPEIERIVTTDRRVSSKTAENVRSLVRELAEGDLIDLQERYVDLFDRGRKTALHLFEHVHGDSRDRGQAMVDLKQVYAQAGYELAAHELPDYLPAVLEFVSLAPAHAADMLADCAHIVRAIGEALQARGSGYCAVLAAVLDATGEAGLAATAAAGDVSGEKSLDDEWREEEVFFGPPNGRGCGSAQPSASIVQFMPRRA